MPAADFLARPGLPGPFGALLDETARAAEDLCRVAEAFSAEAFLAERPSADPDTVSVRSVLCHVLRACRGYANDIRGARGLAREPIDPDLAACAEFRPRLVEQVRYTERTVEPILDLDYAGCRALEFQVSWGPRYDPEMILEHGICHLLRHRRQLERWSL